MFRIWILTVVVYFGFFPSSEAKDYNASLFGIKSDGITLNTGSIQKAVDFISEQGGGRLMFYVGRYLTGTVILKSNVTIHLEEGAVLVGVPVIYDYFHNGDFVSILYGENLENVSVTGKGVIMGNGNALLAAITEQVKNGYIQKATSSVAPGLIQLKDCKNVLLSGVILRSSLGEAIRLDKNTGITMKGITIENAGLPGAGLLLAGNSSLVVADSYFHTSGKEIIYAGKNQDVRIENTKNSTGRKLK
ncbi:MAG: glycosyl hydrolase family 28 protein [Chitinophagaceae bacterium]|nr:glycosyl hydrolase family 28 protein [Chitinophagaceae bacterium]